MFGVSRRASLRFGDLLLCLLLVGFYVVVLICLLGWLLLLLVGLVWTDGVLVL